MSDHSGTTFTMGNEFTRTATGTPHRGDCRVQGLHVASYTFFECLVVYTWLFTPLLDKVLEARAMMVGRAARTCCARYTKRPCESSTAAELIPHCQGGNRACASSRAPPEALRAEAEPRDGSASPSTSQSYFDHVARLGSHNQMKICMNTKRMLSTA